MMNIVRLLVTFTLIVMADCGYAAVILNQHPAKQPAAVSPPTTTQPKTTAVGQPQLVNRIVAIVNNDVITQSQLNKVVVQTKAEAAQAGQSLPDDKVLELQLLKQLINRQLQLQLAKQNNMTVSDEEINSKVAELAKQQGMTVDQFYTEAPLHGFSKQQIHKQVEENLLIQKIQQRAMQQQINVSDQDIDNYLHQLAHNPRVQKLYHVQDILISLPATPSAQQITQAKDKAQVLIKRLNQGADFNKLSASDSQAANALKGGDMGWLQLGELPDEFEKAVVTLQVGQVAGPIRTPNGFHIIKLSGLRGLTPGSALIQVEMRQIVFKPSNKRSPKATQALAHRVYRDLKQGRDFGQLAAKYSQGGHAKKGGYVGWVDPKHHYPQFANTILQLKSGQFSPVLVDKGDYYIVQVIAKRKAFAASKDERKKVKELLYRKQMIEQMQTWLNQLHARAYIKIMLPAADNSK